MLGNICRRAAHCQDISDRSSCPDRKSQVGGKGRQLADSGVTMWDRRQTALSQSLYPSILLASTTRTLSVPFSLNLIREPLFRS